MTGGTESRDELRSEGRNLVQVTALAMLIGGIISSASSVVVLQAVVPRVLATQSLAIGVGAAVVSGAALIVAYRLVEGRLIDMYLDEATGGEPA